MEEQEQQDLNNIQFYLRTLRKKVQHQLKNPFNLNFANYTFEELLNWKNNVLQLDATSRLYGQRVDHLHSGTLHVLGAVVNLELHPAPPSNQKENLQRTVKEIEDEASIFQKCLQTPEKLDGGAVASRHNFLQWRQIMRKRDTLPLLMLNQLSVSTSLSLPLISSQQKPEVYESILKQESVYLKMINFPQLNQQNLDIFEEIEQTVKDIQMFLMSDSHDTKERLRDSFFVDSFQELQLPLASQHKVYSLEYLQKQIYPQHYDPAEDSCLQLPHDHQDYSQKDLQSNYESQTLSLYSINTQSTLSNKAIKKKPKKSKKLKPKKQDGFIDFQGLNPSRSQIFALSQNNLDRFLQQKDYLHLKFIKYPLPFSLRNRHRSKQSMNRPSFSYQTYGFSKQMDFSLQISDPYELNQTLQFTNFSGGLSKRSQIKFKEAALPIKELKKKIRLGIEQQSEISLSRIKEDFKDEEPLDIFISVLHIAAEDCLMIKK